LFAYPFFALTWQQLKMDNNKLNIYTQYLMKSILKLYDFFSQARRACGTTHFVRLCTILHVSGFRLPLDFVDWSWNPCSWRGVLDTKLCDKVCQWLATLSVVFSRYSGVLHQQYWLLWCNWNIVERGVKHHTPTKPSYYYT
jgi:hypothetical protein